MHSRWTWGSLYLNIQMIGLEPAGRGRSHQSVQVQDQGKGCAEHPVGAVAALLPGMERCGELVCDQCFGVAQTNGIPFFLQPFLGSVLNVDDGYPEPIGSPHFAHLSIHVQRTYVVSLLVINKTEVFIVVGFA